MSMIQRKQKLFFRLNFHRGQERGGEKIIKLFQELREQLIEA